MQLLYLLFVMLGVNRVTTEHIFSSIDQALFPFLDLIGMDIKLSEDFT